VFVANMTGNVGFIGFALAGAPGFSLAAALVALAGFLVGAGLAGPVIGRLRQHRGRVLAAVTTAEVALLGAALVVAAIADEPFGATPRNAMAGLAAIAFGMQNTAARELAVPDGTTTVLTMTLTGVAADLRDRNVPVLLRRLLAVVAMLLGGLVGALLVLHVSAAAALAPAVVLVAVVCAATWWVSRRPAPWHERGR
jgi:uncharacterized membrane protein YoaK (UPF0700 family)